VALFWYIRQGVKCRSAEKSDLSPVSKGYRA
jgi:hypothetical protein